MGRTRVIMAAIAALTLTASLAPQSLIASAPAPRATDVFRRINDERRARHLAPLKWDQRLADYAVHWSKTMSTKHKMYHSNIGSLLGRYNYVGENVAFGSKGTKVSALHVSWMKSQPHRDNTLAPGFQNVGVGFYCGADGSIWGTVEFARPASSGYPPPGGKTPQNPIVRSDTNRLGC